MANVALIPALAKTLLAIAWADGELHPEEEATLKEVLGLLPSMTALDWAVIELYIVAPIETKEREELVQYLVQHIRSSADKTIALEAVDAMMAADGAIQPAEEAFARSVREVIAATDVSALGLLRRVVGGTMRAVPRRQTALEVWRVNPVLYLLQTQLQSDVVDQHVATTALAAGIMGQVVRLTPAGTETLRPVLVDALRNDWDAGALAEQLADAALALTHRNIDYHRIARELVARAGEAERVRLLDTLFAIANAADNVAPDEIDEIRVIAERLNLTRAQFIRAKLKIPGVERGGL